MILLPLSIYKYFQISRKEYLEFIDTGKISENYLRCIAYKIINQKDLNDVERTVFYGKTSEVNRILRKYRKIYV